MTQGKESYRKSIAYHEAGHAVISWALDSDRIPYIVSILPGDGVTWAGINSGGGEHTRLEDTICVLFAGYAAQVRYAPDSEERARRGSCDDDEQVESLLVLMVVGPKPNLFSERRRARALVEQHWPLIEQVAMELLRFGTLDDAEVECILNGDFAALAHYREFNGDMLRPPRNARGPVASGSR